MSSGDTQFPRTVPQNCVATSAELPQQRQQMRVDALVFTEEYCCDSPF